MIVLTIAHQKGGVGKTTLALNLAYTFALMGLRAAVSDTDPQGSVSGLSALLDDLDVVPYESVRTGRLTGYHVVIVDTPPYLTSRLEELFDLSDYVLVPTKVGYLDFMAIKATLAMLDKSHDRRPSLKAGIVLNMCKPRTSLNAEIRDLLGYCRYPVHQSVITERVSYTRSLITRGIHNGSDSKAMGEILDLASEIMARFQPTEP